MPDEESHSYQYFRMGHFLQVGVILPDGGFLVFEYSNNIPVLAIVAVFDGIEGVDCARDYHLTFFASFIHLSKQYGSDSIADG